MIIKRVLQANTCLRDVHVHANLFSSSSSSEIHVKLVYLIKFHPSDVHVKFDRISVVFSGLRRTLFKFWANFTVQLRADTFKSLILH